MTPAEPCLVLLGTPTWQARDGQAFVLLDTLPSHLVAVMALRDAWVPREELATLFWPDRGQDQAQHNLRTNLHRVRALLTGWGCGDALEAERFRVRGTCRPMSSIGARPWPRANTALWPPATGGCCVRVGAGTGSVLPKTGPRANTRRSRPFVWITCASTRKACKPAASSKRQQRS